MNRYMSLLSIVFVVSFASVACLGAEAVVPAGKIKLFDGQSFEGWFRYLRNGQGDVDSTWQVKPDGILACSGKPAGYIRTTTAYKDYKFRLEYRWPAKPGNNGVLVHSTTPGALGVWPQSIEVQLAHNNAGDFWVIGTDLDVPNEETRKKGRRHLNLKDNSEKPLGEWNRMEIACQGDGIVVKVNGELVNRAEKCSVTMPS